MGNACNTGSRDHTYDSSKRAESLPRQQEQLYEHSARARQLKRLGPNQR